MLGLFDAMVAAHEAAGVATPAVFAELRRLRETAIGPASGLAISRWIERLRGLAEIRAPIAFLDHEIAAVPQRESEDPTIETGVRWNLSPDVQAVGPALRACIAWELGILGFGGVAVEAGVDAIRLAAPPRERPLFQPEDLVRSFEVPEFAVLEPAALVPNAALLGWADRVAALPDRLPIDVSHARAREVVRGWQRDQGRPPAWFLAHPDRGSPEAVPLMAITLRARWSDAWAERRALFGARLRELAPFGFGMLVFEGRYAPVARQPAASAR
jgi:hypothetical protein